MTRELSTPQRTGGCLCGAVCYTVEGEPLEASLCHCLDCRKESGRVFSFCATWPILAFEFSGETRTFRGRSFCPQCGSRLFNLQDQTVEIRLGSLDNGPTGLAPAQEIWVKRREHWLAALPAVPQHDQDP
jgi:hypothetical protein